jgi:hypothetical protein
VTRSWSLCLAVAAAWTAAALAQTPGPAAPPAGRGMLIGQVVEAGGTRPVSGAVVTLGGMPSLSSSPVVFSVQQAAIPGGNRTVLTSARGHFVFSDLPAGAYSLQATKPGYSPGAYGRRRPTGSAQTVVVSGDGVANLTIPVWKFATLSGTVTDEAGEPVVGVQVRAMRRVFDRGRPQFVTAAAGMTAETDDRGTFRIATLIPAEYVVAISSTQATVPRTIVEAYRAASASGRGADFNREMSASGSPLMGSLTSGVPVGDFFFQSETFGARSATPPPASPDGKLFVYPIHFFPGTSSASQATLIRLEAGEDRAGIELHLKPVAASRVSGIVTDPAGPVANLALSLVAATNSMTSDNFFETATTISDARGAFVFLGVPSGQYTLRAMKLPVRPPTRTAQTTVVQTGSTTMTSSTNVSTGLVTSGIPDGPTWWVMQPVNVENADVTGVTVSLQNGFKVSGRVEFEGSATAPADFAQRLLVTFEPADDRSMPSLTVNRAAIAADGRLSTYELPPGRYYVRVQGSVPGWSFKHAVFNGRDISDTPLDLQGPVNGVTLGFTERPSVLRGTVRTRQGAPDATALVVAFPVAALAPDFTNAPRRMTSARVSPSGAFEISGLPSGEYFVAAVADDIAGDFPSLAFLRSLARSASRVVLSGATSATQDLTTVSAR